MSNQQNYRNIYNPSQQNAYNSAQQNAYAMANQVAYEQPADPIIGQFNFGMKIYDLKKKYERLEELENQKADMLKQIESTRSLIPAQVLELYDMDRTADKLKG